MSSFETRRQADVNVSTNEGPALAPEPGAWSTLALPLLLVLLVLVRLLPMDKATVLT